MRKFFALALAVAMVLSLASVSFAASSEVVDLVGPFRYDADKNIMLQPKNAADYAADGPKTAQMVANEDNLRYGDGVYYLIKINDHTDTNGIADAYAAQESYKKIEKLKLKPEFEAGEDLVESVSIVKKYVNVGDNTTKTIANAISGSPSDADDGYYYFVEFKVAKKETTAEADIIATLEFNRKADDDIDNVKINDEEQEAEFTVFYQKTWTGAEAKITTDRENLKWDTDYALKFEADDEVELSFGHSNDGNNEGTFNVDVSGQGKVYLKYNTKANEAIAAANPGVEMDFISFNNVKFNRVGEFVYEMDDIAAAYKVVGDQLVEIKGLDLDSDSATFNTRVLESYVFATAELVNPVAEAPVVEAPVATNPSTGAAA